MDRNRWARLDQKVVFFACDAFMRGKNAKRIAQEVSRRFGEPLHRTQVYQVISEGRARGYFHPTPPREELLSERMMDRFVRGRRAARPGGGGKGDDDRKDITVVTRGSEVSLEHVALAAAKTALDIVQGMHKKMASAPGASREAKPPEVHVGFGAGETMMLVARYFAERLRSQVSPPPVVLHALSSGFNVDEPAKTPVAFFNFFHGIPGVSYTGMFASAFVTFEDWDRMRDHVGVRESFAAKEKLQLVITALASRQDPHGELNRFMAVNAELGEQTRQLLDVEEGRVGDVLYRPFTAERPITRKAGIRAVTLFELEELVDFAAREDKAVLLVAGPCGSCTRSRSDALLPLLTQPALDVWSHLVTDDITAVQCLKS